MGKKARKTRWKALSIEEPRSETSSPTFANKVRQNGAPHKYTSSHSTPTHQRAHRDRWAHQKDTGKTSVSTRSNSSCSETKIKFNEEEYTKITTPRQDVLFKKGYLSKPKPYLQRPLTSAGTSTGDGTPDHQSADGADDFEQFSYPNPNLCFYEMSTATAPMILYDNFGNSVVYYPPPQQHYNNNHDNHDYHSNHDNIDNLADVEIKKRSSIDTDTSNNETNDENMSEISAEIDTISQETDTISPETDTISPEVSLKVDAEEFVPRNFVPNYNFVPFCPPEFFGGHFVILPPSLPPFNNFYPVPGQEVEPEMQPEQEVTVENVPNCIDIQKIVHKLEQAAQEIMESEEVDAGTVVVDAGTVVVDAETVVVDAETVEIQPKTVENRQEVHVKQQVMPCSAPVQVPEAPIKYSDRLKSTFCPKPTIPKVLKTFKPEPVKTCPRLHRQSSKNKQEVPLKVHKIDKIKTLNEPKNPQVQISENMPNSGACASSDTWVSVSARKKRKNAKNCDDNSEQNYEIFVEPEVVTKQEVPVEQEVQVVKQEVQEMLVHVEQEVPPKKTQKEAKKGKKLVKKRVIVSDVYLCEPEVVGTPAQPEIRLPETKTKQEAVVPAEQLKKPKKKRSKAKLDTLSDSDLNISNSSESLSISGHSTVTVTDAVDVSEVELELEKMIQRGLYANLEQKLEKNDRFLTNLGGANPFGNLFSPPKLSNTSTLPFPQIVLPKSEKATPQPKFEVAAPVVPEYIAAQPSGKLSVTEAVKQWINVTRETTPEVEIFRKPEEIRQITKVLSEIDIEVQHDDIDDDLQIDRSPNIIQRSRNLLMTS